MLSTVCKLITQVSAALNSEVQFFATHRVVEGHAWVRALPSTLMRAFCYIGESGEIIFNFGKRSPDERKLSTPNENDVMHLAGKWSIDPTRLPARLSTVWWDDRHLQPAEIIGSQ